MAAINVGQLSDVELRARLQSLGENVGPITTTTRGVWEKKLSKTLKCRGEVDVNKTRNIEEDVKKKKSGISKTKRVSNAMEGGRNANTCKFALFSSDDDAGPCVNNDKKPANKSKRDFVDPNESNIEIIPSSSSLYEGSKRRSMQNSSHTGLTTTPSRKSYNKEDFSDNDLPPAPAATSHLALVKNTGINTNSNSTKNSNFRSRKTQLVSCDGSTNNDYSHDEGLPEQNYSKFVSPSFDPRKTPISNSNNMRDEIDASLIQIRNSYSRKKPTPTNCNYNEKEKGEEELVDVELISEKKSSYGHISCNRLSLFKIVPLLIIALLLFGWYMYNEDDRSIPAISNESDKKDGLDLEFINCLYQKLSILAGHAECGYVESKWVKSNFLQEFAKPCLAEQSAFSGSIEQYEIFHTLNTTYPNHFELNNQGDMSSKSSYRPLICRINQALSVLAYRLIMIIIIISSLIGGYFIMKKRWTADDEEMRRILYFVERIIDTLQRHHEVCQTNKDLPPFLPIPHVRDMLIPLAKRKKMARVWRKAVALLNSSESRVRVETQRIAGEDFDVWRWIGVCTPKQKKEKKATNETYLTNEQEKCWQGPAFDEIEKVVRMPIVTPTPCLKIRYMHEGLEEKEAKWVKRVENAVLEKCNLDGAQILHIFVDKTSKEGCVYVKCDSLESAGRAFRCMYGNWFDCRLVIVKFVTLARYHQRFPDALRCVEPLKADPSMPSSLNWLGEDNK